MASTSKAVFVKRVLENPAVTRDLLQSLIREKTSHDASLATMTVADTKPKRVKRHMTGGGKEARVLCDVFSKEQLFSALWMKAGTAIPHSWTKPVLAHTLIVEHGMDRKKLERWVLKHLKQKPHGSGAAQKERNAKKSTT